MGDQIDTAVEAAREAYSAADHNPLDHGHAWVAGIDGRTSIARELRAHEDVSVRSDGGTTVTISGVDRYLGAQQAAYRAFLDEIDIEGAHIESHGH